ncbi:alpha-galactosidase [Arachidicoccus terrestris]|uniref:alpha-galactosidase n=1 Tax=Arachidicoccus terrestris TaxID=2875539 RepID=UPI001CC8025E|nr:alpha-galactosidase [Arachidicoccus terrestris]UAY56969.1 alpha-galactosidase [Arachidicoccus terrestris]
MKKWILIFSLLFLYKGQSYAQSSLPVIPEDTEQLFKGDWLVIPCDIKASAYQSHDGKDIILTNGLVRRSFRIQPNVTCFDYTNLSNGQQLLRANEPEAVIEIDGIQYNIGGLYGEKQKAYLLPAWLNELKAHENDFQFQSYSVTDLQPFIRWQPKGWAMNKTQPTGKSLAFVFKSNNDNLQNITITVHYDLYDGLPLIAKWVSIKNNGTHKITIGRVINEKLAVVEEESAVVGSVAQMEKQHGLYIETDYAFNNAMRYDISDQTTHWKADSTYTSQVNYDYQTPCLLEIYPRDVTAVQLDKGKEFKSVRTYELLMDSYDRERRGLCIRRMYRKIAPWTTENPIFMHLISKTDAEVKNAIDQCAATGYEALILSFGSHCNMEDTSAANLRKWKDLAAYAHRKGIIIGGYSLFSSRRISDSDDVIDPVTGKPDAGAFFGHAPCLGSRWGLGYLQKLKRFISYTGFDIFENDGPYPGDLCASTKHPGHKGLGDSQWKQMTLAKGFYRWCSEQGVYVNAPDWYFLSGTNKIALGYREVNFSLPRQTQQILNRQNIYDGLWEKTPSMSWGFVPLTRYQGGGPEAVLEPLADHLKDYEALMMQYYGAGVQACYRGPRLYDTPETKEAVVKIINWYKQYRSILNSDIIHLRRADGRDWDGIMHVNPSLTTKALVMLYNPLKEDITRTVTLPLYYSGLTRSAEVMVKANHPTKYMLNRDYEIKVTITIPAESNTWLTIK